LDWAVVAIAVFSYVGSCTGAYHPVKSLHPHYRISCKISSIKNSTLLKDVSSDLLRPSFDTVVGITMTLRIFPYCSGYQHCLDDDLPFDVAFVDHRQDNEEAKESDADMIDRDRAGCWSQCYKSVLLMVCSAEHLE